MRFSERGTDLKDILKPIKHDKTSIRLWESLITWKKVETTERGDIVI